METGFLLAIDNYLSSIIFNAKINGLPRQMVRRKYGYMLISAASPNNEGRHKVDKGGW